MDPTDIRLPGAVPLRAPGTAKPGVIDVTEASFETDVLVRSQTVPVILDFWASWCGPCRQLSPVLERLAGEADGAWVLAKVDVDANPRLAQAAAVQGIPAVKAVVDGQVAAEFTGALPEAQVRDWLAELLAAVAAAAAPGPEDGTGPLVDPALELADQALIAGDLDGATVAYQRLLADPATAAAAHTGLARAELLRRTQGVDDVSLRRRLAEQPDDAAVAAALADVELLSGHAEAAFTRLVELVRRTSGTERDDVRSHLLGLFDVLGHEDPRVLAARRALASALF